MTGALFHAMVKAKEKQVKEQLEEEAKRTREEELRKAEEEKLLKRHTVTGALLIACSIMCTFLIMWDTLSLLDNNRWYEDILIKHKETDPILL